MKRLYCMLMAAFALSIAEPKAQESPEYFDYLANQFGTRAAVSMMFSQMLFSPPEGFYCDRSTVSSDFLRSPDYTFWASAPWWYCLRSESKDFLTLIYIDACYSRDGIYMYIPGMEKGLEKWKGPFVLMEDIINSSLNTLLYYNTGKDGLEHHPIRYLPTGYAKRAFNADTVITFPLTIWGKPYKKHYKHAQGMLMKKKGKSHIILVTLYTDEGEKHLDSYLQSLEKMFWFRDPEDFLPFEYQEPEINVTIKPTWRQRRKLRKSIVASLP